MHPRTLSKVEMPFILLALALAAGASGLERFAAFCRSKADAIKE